MQIQKLEKAGFVSLQNDVFYSDFIFRKQKHRLLLECCICYIAIFLSFFGSVQDFPLSLQCIFSYAFINSWAKKFGYVIPRVFKWTLARWSVWYIVVEFISNILRSLHSRGARQKHFNSEAPLKRKHHKYVVLFSALSEAQFEVAAYHNQSVIRCLLFPVFTGYPEKNLSWKIQKERQYFELFLD